MSKFTHEITLPSQGILNSEIPDGKVTQRCMMVQDQKALAGSKKDSGLALRELLQNTITAPEGFDVSKLTASDTLYLLFKLRILSYGSTYKFKSRCPECGKRINIELDLADLTVDTLPEDYEERLVVELPHSGDTVYTKILTNADTDMINDEIKRRKRRNETDDSAYILRMVYAIDKIVINKDKKELTHPIDIERYITTLTDLDATAILSTREDVAYGINPIIEHVCPECGEYIDVSVQFSGEFFRPHFSRK